MLWVTALQEPQEGAAAGFEKSSIHLSSGYVSSSCYKVGNQGGQRDWCLASEHSKAVVEL